MATPIFLTTRIPPMELNIIVARSEESQRTDLNLALRRWLLNQAAKSEIQTKAVITRAEGLCELLMGHLLVLWTLKKRSNHNQSHDLH